MYVLFARINGRREDLLILIAVRRRRGHHERGRCSVLVFAIQTPLELHSLAGRPPLFLPLPRSSAWKRAKLKPHFELPYLWTQRAICVIMHYIRFRHRYLLGAALSFIVNEFNKNLYGSGYRF